MQFLVDAQLPPAPARWLSEQGHPSRHVADLGLAAAPDYVIWDTAMADGAAVITKDEDFALRRTHARTGPQVVRIRRGNVSRRELLLWFEPLLTIIVQRLAAGEPLVEVV